MKKLFTFLFFVILIFSANAQVAINSTGATPDGSAILDINSADKGLLIPRVSLSDVANASPISSPAVGLTVWNTNTSITDGYGKGMYFWSGSKWIIIQSINGGIDADFYVEGTTNLSMDITDDIYHSGNLAIGKNMADYQLDISTTSSLRSANILQANTSNSDLYSLYLSNTGTGSGTHYGIYNENTGGTGTIYASKNIVNNNTDAFHIASDNVVSGSGDGTKVGVRTILNNSGNGIQYGMYNSLTGTGTNEHYGIYNALEGSGTGSQTGIWNAITNTGNDAHYAIYNVLEGSGQGSQYGIYNEITNDGDDATKAHFGLYTAIDNDGDNDHYGTYTDLKGAGDGTQYGANLSVSNTGDGIHYGLYQIFTGTGSGNHYGSQNIFAGAGTGTFYSYSSSIEDSGNGDKYGSYQKISCTGSGKHYGTYNLLIGNNTGTHTGTRNVIGGSGNGSTYAIYNAVTNSGSGIHYSSYNSITQVNSASAHYAGYFNAPGDANDYAAVFNAGNVVANEIGGDYDFRIETDNRTNAFFVDAGNDRIGIGTSSPTHTLTVIHGSTNPGAGDGLTIRNIGSNNNYWTLYTRNDNGFFRFYYKNNYRSQIDPSTGAYTYTSDKRLKTDIQNLYNVLDKVMKLKVVDYYMINENNKTNKHIGLIAQEVEKIFPSIVTPPTIQNDLEQDCYMMDYSAFGVISIKAIQEQQVIINKQQEEIDDLKTRVEQLEKLISNQ